MKQIVFLFLFLSSFIHAQTWTSVTSVPTAGRDDGICFALNGSGYIVTGYLGTFAESNKLFQYDASTNSWNEKSVFPGIARQYSSVFTLNNKAYIVGGYSEFSQALNDVWEYDAFTNSWSQKTNFPGIARWHATATSIRNTAYLGMGTTADSTLADFWKYNPDLDSWIQLSNYPGGPNRSVLGFSLFNEGIFGEGFDINPITYSNSWYSFNPSTETWTSFPPLPAGLRSYGTAISNEMSAIVCGGMDENSIFKNDCFYLDHTKTWRAIPALPVTGLKGAKGFALNGRFYLGTGLNDNLTRISDFFQYTPEMKSPKESLLFPNPSKDYFNLITEANAKVSLLSIGGQLIKQFKTNDSGFLEITNLPIGLYLLLIEGKKSSEIKKIAKV
ncbi:T9SS C-terminal target domain-containing protein [Fluviicola taffensis]|uniref:Kelch repeat type 1-containing protein n=1 Tax=Fluviicola taffensis (strain DSM 16823 / NCIMB 13979 / RW262) TaxID=755732 RepID=F2IAV1_FLUTR|nr:T9SS C-terminal target domain-containing protein [Fluviicola taffensis]AEA45275.1 Kelch repeat type 1-containing protein [Fluviicola taffensis DSM 16823]